MKMTQYDISNAFLNAELDNKLFMKPPPGYPLRDKNKLLLLRKALYGLKQASRLWQQTLYGTLKEMGLDVCKTESGVMKIRSKEGKLTILLFWVDDIICSSNDEAMRARIVKKLESDFLVKCLGPLSHYIGIVLDPIDNEEGYIIHQGPYHKRYIKKYLDEYAKICSIPALSHTRLSELDCPVTDEDKAKIIFPYMSSTGSLLYSALCTRPDIFFAVIQLARFNANPGKTHVKANQQVLRYIKGTMNQGLKFSKDKNFDGKIRIRAFVDSDWAGCIDTRRSTMGYIIHVSGCPVAWKSKLMKTLALSSCEAEFMALTEVCREIMWMCRFLEELGIDYHMPEIYCDSSSAINWACDPIQHQRNKHVELKYYFVRDQVMNGKVIAFKIHGTRNHSDPMTKPVGPQILRRHLPAMTGFAEPNIGTEPHV